MSDDEEQPPSAVVIEAVADAEGVEPTELDPLYQFVDPDALDTLAEGGGTRISFEFEGYLVTVRGDGEVEVQSTREESH